MAKKLTPGTRFPAGVGLEESQRSTALTDANLLQGGKHHYATIAGTDDAGGNAVDVGRDRIPLERRSHRMVVSVDNDGTGVARMYELFVPNFHTLSQAGKEAALSDNANWRLLETDTGANLTKGVQSTVAGADGTFPTGFHTGTQGKAATANNAYAFAVGEGTVASGRAAFAAGDRATAAGNASLAHGIGARAGGDNSVAIGQSATVDAAAPGGLAVGLQARSSGTNALALGFNANASGAGAVAVGDGTASGSGSVALGKGQASGGSSLAHGQGSQASGQHATAWISPVYIEGHLSVKRNIRHFN